MQRLYGDNLFVGWAVWFGLRVAGALVVLTTSVAMLF
jgi:hypothetical protein